MPAVAIPTPSGTPAWLAYAVPGPEPAGRAMIAIVLDDVGLNRINAERAIELPAPITLSFMTYADDLPQQAAEARRLGHELMLHVPMEPLDRASMPARTCSASSCRRRRSAAGSPGASTA